ncbi:SANT/Myb_domain [Hexamita inflata]|uniref:SANT/Myb domain n=1 Tax=Hexamita inflata TaxID=28002 RepID=A0AA86P5X8_9EUKA|nr:SANT/Myb domain [Hexamita inflata]CAI9973112.1 SANT/Myb domain [Hexamita inflata]
MKQQRLTEQMLSNFSTLQEIHQISHEINRIKTKCTRIHRDRWSQEEDVILFDLLQIIGNRDCNAISALIGSKTSSQVYQRLRYLKQKRFNLSLFL